MENKINKLLDKADKTIRHYPWVVVMALIAAILAIITVELLDNQRFQAIHPYKNIVLKLYIVANLGISVFFGIKVAQERYGKRLWFYLIGIGILALTYFILPYNMYNISRLEDIKMPIYIVAIYAGVHLLIAFIPFLKANYTDENRFWEYNKNLFVNYIIAGIFTGVIILGLFLSYWAISELFGVHFEETYINTAIFSGIFINCFIFLSFSENLANLERIDRAYPVVLKFFVQFVMIPLLLLYGLILYTYTIKILISQTLPKGGVSFMIMGYSLLGILAYLLLYPLGNQTVKSWVGVFFKIFFKTIFPLLLLLYVAIFTRVLAYGITENRYFVLAFAVWLTIVLGYFTFKKEAKISFIPKSLVCAIFLTVAMPFTNAFYISKWQQKQEMMALLRKANVLKDGKIDFQMPISEDDLYLLRTKILFFKHREYPDPLLEIIPESLKDELLEDFKYMDYYTDFTEYFTNVVKSDKETTEDGIIDDYSNYSNTYLTKYYVIKKTTPQGYSNYVLFDGFYPKHEIEAGVFLEINLADDVLLTINETKYSYPIAQDVINYIEKNKIIEQTIAQENTIIEETTNLPEAPEFHFNLADYEFVIVTSNFSFDIDRKNRKVLRLYAEYNQKNIVFYRKNTSK